MQDELGDRMKAYEGQEAGRRLMPMLPTLARLDGKCFHRFTRGLDRPFDLTLVKMMQDLAVYMVEQTNALIGYTQSDELTLAWYSDDYNSQIYFDGKVHKMVSVLAAQASVYFNQVVAQRMPDKLAMQPVFDARVWQVPTLIEAANVFVWREADAVRNSIQSAARSVYSHTECLNKSSKQLQEMLWQRGINWNGYDDCLKRGTYVKRIKTVRKYTAEELDSLSAQHDARKNPNLCVERSEVIVVHMPRLSQVTNRTDVLFDANVQDAVLRYIQ